MNKSVCLLLISLSFFKIYSQKTNNNVTVISKSTITSIGSFSTIPIDENHKIVQCIGQSGSIGTKKSNSLTVQQGYITNMIFYKIDNSEKDEFEEKLDLVLYPNPFVEYIKIDFSKKTVDDVSVQIFDLNGRIHFSKTYQPTDNIIIQMSNFTVSTTYLAIISSGKNEYVKKIIKVN